MLEWIIKYSSEYDVELSLANIVAYNEKTFLRGLRPGQTQNSPLGYRY